MIGPFAVGPENLEGLGDKGAVDLVRRLIWADAAASGIAGDQIRVPAPQDVRDGGADAEVIHSDADSRYGTIKKGNTRYRVESGRFTPSEAGIKGMLLDGGGDLKGWIKSCLDKGGTLVVAFTKWGNPGQTDEAATGRFREVLADISPEYGDARIVVWSQNTMMGMLDHFPAIRLHLLGASREGHYSIDGWAGLSDMGNKAHLGASQKQFIAELRGYLRDDGRAMHVRITGEPGMGKTRLALEACSADDLGGLVVYVDSPRSLGKGGIVHWLASRNVDARAILVVDGCDYESLAYYWNMIEEHSPRTKMVTIYSEPGGDGKTTESMTVPPLSDAEIGMILSGYGIKKEELREWIKMCRPYPRAAHMIGQSLAMDRGDPIRPADAVDGWNSLIARRLGIDEPEYRARRAVLLWLGIFKRFGYGEGRKGREGRILQELVSRYEGVSPGDFHRTVSKLRDMKVLQGSQTLYITPKTLHVYLWSQWWRTYGDADLPEILGVLDRAAEADGERGLRGWFYDMFVYAGGVIDAEGAVGRLLGAGGLLEGGGAPGAGHGASDLLALGRAAPATVLEHLEKAVAGAGPGEGIVRSVAGRRGIVWALDYIAKRTGHTERAAHILVTLAEAENEPCLSNNATGVLHDIFVPSSSSLPPADQLELLESINGSPDVPRKRLAIGGCKRALDPDATAPYFDTDEPPLPPRGPQRGGALAARVGVVRYRRGALDMLGAHIEEGGPLAEAAADVVLDLARPLLREPELAGRVAGLLEAIHRSGRRAERLIAALENAVETCGGMVDAAVMDRVRSLLEGAEGDDVHSQLKKYVGRDGGRRVGLCRSQDDEDARMRDLAGIALRGGALAGELPWLVTGEAEAGHRFGYALAAQDHGYTMLAAILEAVRNAGARANGLLVGGYLAHMRKGDPERWASVLDSVYGDRGARAVLPDLIIISGITDVSLPMIIRGVSSGAFPCDALDVLQYPHSVSSETLAGCLEMLLGRPEKDAAVVALRLVYHHFARGGNHLPRDLVESVLLHPHVVGPPAQGADHAPMDPWMWKEAAMRLLERFPDRRPTVAAALVESFAESELLQSDGSTSLDVLEGAARADPDRVWGMLSGRIEPPFGRRDIWLRSWMRGRLSGRKGSIMPAFPMGVVLEWVAERPGERAAHLAGILPDDFEVLRPFLSEYGDRDDVREALEENLLGGAWLGPGAGESRAKAERYAGLRGGEGDARVASWLNDILERIDRRIDLVAEEDMRAA